MAINRNFGKLVGDTVDYAKTYIATAGKVVVNPTDEMYSALGYLRVARDEPNPPEGQHVASTRWEVGADGLIHAVFAYEADPVVPRIISKIYLRLALESRGLDGLFDDFIDERGLRAKWNDATELNEGFPGFEQMRADAVAALCITDAKCEEILSEAVAR